MFYFYYKEPSHFTKQIAAKLDEMVVAHKICRVNNSTDLPQSIKVSDLPVLRDDQESWKSKKAITTFLDDLHTDLTIIRGMQSDACHIDPDNPSECL